MAEMMRIHHARDLYSPHC